MQDGYIFITKKITLKFLALPIILLRAYFRYSAWHNSIYLQRPYAQKIVSYLNHRMLRNNVLEIGCGTGDILRRLNYAVKTGLDYEKEALNALNFLSYFNNCNGKIVTGTFDFLADDVKGEFDVIILCNWIHEIEPTFLQKKIEYLFDNNLICGGEIIIDIIDNPAYRFNHRILDLTQNLNCSLSELGNFERGRTVISIFKYK